ncbi:MAG: tryptophan synthase alpha chain [Verrucomicrobiales bacterium]|jgi:tryptophan synthase alpha chain
MNRIDATFAKLKETQKAAFVGYICAGDPSLEATCELALSLEKDGVDILELGVPFSDPMADGTVNQQAAERALAAGATVPRLFDAIRTIRESSQIPIVLFTYLNPVYTYGFEKFIADAAAAGADGILLLDLPPEEQAANAEMANCEGLKTIRLVAPTSGPERIASIAKGAEGFIYYVCREGVTGVRDDIVEGLGAQVKAIQDVATVPVVVGFGISKPDQAAAVARDADGVVVGSAIVKTIAEFGNSPDLTARVSALVKPLVDATKSAC